MTSPSFLERTLGVSLREFTQMAAEQRAAAARDRIPDLHYFFDGGRALAQRQAPRRTLALAQSLFAALEAAEPDGEARRTRIERLVTDGLLRAEADRDQNVYMGRFYTRHVTRAVPDLIFQPVSIGECEATLAWARAQRVPVTLRGAASTAMGGAVPNDAGLALDLSRLDQLDVDGADNVVFVGAGARLRTVHQRLAARGLALHLYPSNLGGTLVGWFVTGGIGLNAFGRGRARDGVKAADVLLPSGEHVRFHDDGRLDVFEARHRRTLPASEAAAWFTSRGLVPMGLADLAGSEGALGVVLSLAMQVEPRPEIGAFLLSFAGAADALAAAEWIGREAGRSFGAPANVKFFSGSHMHHVRRVWTDEARREWKEAPSALSSGAHMPWTRIVGPGALGAATAADRVHAGGYLFVDFLSLEHARAFARTLPTCPGAPRVLEEESARVAAERFKPQQTKRLGPGLLAAEIVMPASEVAAFLPRAEALARAAGNALDAEAYFLGDGSALVIAGYLVDHRRGSMLLDLGMAPALLDLAMAHHQARPYVLGRWQAAYFGRKFGAGAARLRDAKRRLDPQWIVNRGVLVGMRLRGPIGALMAATLVPGIGLLRRVLSGPFGAAFARGARAVLAVRPGPAAGRGEPIRSAGTRHGGEAGVTAAGGAGGRDEVGLERSDPAISAMGGSEAAARPGPERSDGAPARSVPPAPPAAVTPASPSDPAPAQWGLAAAARALHCVNCGECNSVCPIFHESKIRLPQMLTHLGEAAYAGEEAPASGGALLDLCMRCGNCEEVCQAGIPHLPLYEHLQRAADARRPHDRERHLAVLAAVRGSSSYLREFLDVRPGAYQKRTPASLPGVTRYLLFRAESDAGPAATCIHCGACVAVCPTAANQEFEGVDPRLITTDQERCIGCGTCVEVCPANHQNGGRTLRVMEAPTAAWFEAIGEFERQQSAKTAART